MKGRYLFTIITFAICGLMFTPDAVLAGVTCGTSSGSGYCDYTGTVAQVYSNANGTILLYFDAPFDPSVPASVGLAGVSFANAAIYMMSSNPQFAQMLYATLLAAQAEGKVVTVQMSAVYNGYLEMDRVWLSQ